MNLLDIQGMQVRYATPTGAVTAVDGVDLHVDAGEIVGLAGESGCGKTSLALAVPRLLPAAATLSRGHVVFDGKDLTTLSEHDINAVRWRDISVVFQGAMNALNPVHTVGHQIAEPIRRHDPDLPSREARDRARELLTAVGIPADRADAYPHEFSGGMRQRVMIAMSLACRPRLVIADEPTTALDVMTQAQILDLLRKLSADMSLSMLIISHDLSVLAELCDRVVVMYAGKVVEDGTAGTVFAADPAAHHARHPYTRRLLQAYPHIHRERSLIAGIPGAPPDLANPPPGCRFADRCDQRIAVCTLHEPALLPVDGGQHAACHVVAAAVELRRADIPLNVPRGPDVQPPVDRLNPNPASPQGIA